MKLESDGFAIILSTLPESLLDRLRDDAFQLSTAGERCLLDRDVVRETATALKAKLAGDGILAPDAVAIQAIAFDKTAAKNWKVPWHQDLMFPFAERVSAPGFDLPAVKQGVHYARPPAAILGRLLAARLHLDDCELSNGPLRISPGTHRDGILASADISGFVARHGEIAAVAKSGELLLMRPLLLHASSQATDPRRRRVLHFVFDSGGPLAETWHRAV